MLACNCRAPVSSPLFVLIVLGIAASSHIVSPAYAAPVGSSEEALLFTTDEVDDGMWGAAGACGSDDESCPWLPISLDEDGVPTQILTEGASPCHGHSAIGGPTCEAVFRTTRESNRGVVNEVRLVHGGTVDGGVGIRYRIPFAIPDDAVVRIVGYVYHPHQPSPDTDGAHAAILINTQPVWEASLRPGDSYPISLALRGPFEEGDAVVVTSFHQRNDDDLEVPSPEYDDIRARVGIVVPAVLCAGLSAQDREVDGVSCRSDVKLFSSVVPPIERGASRGKGAPKRKQWPVTRRAPRDSSAEHAVEAEADEHPPLTGQGSTSPHDGTGRITPSATTHTTQIMTSLGMVTVPANPDGTAVDPCERTRKTCIKIEEGCQERRQQCLAGEAPQSECARLPTCESLKATCTNMLQRCESQRDTASNTP